MEMSIIQQGSLYLLCDPAPAERNLGIVIDHTDGSVILIAQADGGEVARVTHIARDILDQIGKLQEIGVITPADDGDVELIAKAPIRQNAQAG